MITWNDPQTQKPPIDKSDKWNEEQQISPTILIALVSKETQTEHVVFGTYFHKTDHWSFGVSYRGEGTVIGWSEVNFPNRK